jgi:hypothetical protein
LAKLLLAFANTVSPGLSLLEIHDQDFYSLLDMYVFENGAFSSTKERSVYVGATWLRRSLNKSPLLVLVILAFVRTAQKTQRSLLLRQYLLPRKGVYRAAA